MTNGGYGILHRNSIVSRWRFDHSIDLCAGDKHFDNDWKKINFMKNKSDGKGSSQSSNHSQKHNRGSTKVNVPLITSEVIKSPHLHLKKGPLCPWPINPLHSLWFSPRRGGSWGGVGGVWVYEAWGVTTGHSQASPPPAPWPFHTSRRDHYAVRGPLFTAAWRLRPPWKSHPSACSAGVHAHGSDPELQMVVQN